MSSPRAEEPKVSEQSPPREEKAPAAHDQAPPAKDGESAPVYSGRDRSQSPERKPRSRSRSRSPRRRGPPPASTNDASPRLYVGNLAWATTRDGLSDAFSAFGLVTDAHVSVDRNSGRSRGFGFVTFENQDDAIRARDELNDTDLDGRIIRIDFARPRSERPPRREFNRNDRYADRGDRYGDRGDRYADRGDRYGDRGDRGDRYGDRGDRYADRGAPRYERDSRGGDRYSDRRDDRRSEDRYGDRSAPRGGDRYGNGM